MAATSWIERLRTLSRSPAVRSAGARAGRLGRFLLLTLRRTHRDGVPLTAAALAYVTILSLIPLLAATSFAGALVFSAYPEQSLEFLLQALPYHEEAVVEQIERFFTQSRQVEGWTILAFFATALFAFGTVEETINRIWDVARRRSLRVRFMSFTMLIFWGPVLIGATYSAYLVLRRRIGPELLESPWSVNMLPFLGTLVGLTMLYHLVPYTRVSFRAALAGGVTAAVLLEVLRLSFGLYVGLLTRPTEVYGPFAFALFFAISIQVSWTIVLYGSELAYCAQHHGALVRGLGRGPHFQGRWVGLAATLVLAERLDRGTPRTPQGELADDLRVPEDKLEQMLEPLMEAGHLAATPGRDREYLLARPPHKTSVARLLAAYDARSHRVFEPLADRRQDALDDVAARIARGRERDLDRLTLADLVDAADGDGDERPRRPGGFGRAGRVEE